MGGASPQKPQLGSQLNSQFEQAYAAARQARKEGWETQSSDLFQTLLKTGQKPYSSPYEPEDYFAPMSNQNPGPFDSMFNRLG
jgi:hypothetical protein